MSSTPVTLTFIAAAGLLVIGLYTLLITRNLIKVVVALQILVKGVMLSLVAAGEISGQISLAQSMALTVIVADTIVAVIALSIAVIIRRKFGTLDLNAYTTLKR
jgi:NADH:ubiquinone oxidoreductase subunit K